MLFGNALRWDVDYLARQFPVVATDIVHDRFRFFQELNAAPVKGIPGFRQRQPARGTQQQRDAKLGLELADVKADDRLRLTQRPCRSREAFRVHHRHEGRNPLQIQHLSSAVCQNNFDSISRQCLFIRKADTHTLRPLQFRKISCPIAAR